MGFTIPTSFTAEDKFSSVVMGMGANMEAFGMKAEAVMAKSERAFRKMTPVIGHAAKEFLEMASTAALAAGIVEGIEFSYEAVEHYEEKMANLKATTGLSGKAFEEFNSKILEVAKSSKKSAVDVADVFNVVAKANPDLMDNVDALGKVSDASILLAKATGMELGPAAESLSTMMNKMGVDSEEAASTVDILAAASLAGKYKINDLSDGLTQFGATAKSMGMSLIEDTALLQLSSTFRIAGEGANESGAHIKKFLMVLETSKTISPQLNASLRHMGVNTKILSDATVPLAEKLTMLQKIQGKGALIDKMFGPRNAEFVKGLLAHADGLEAIIDKTSQTGKAEEMAAVREDTLSESLSRLKNAWINMIIGSGKAGEGLTIFQRGIEFLTNHLDTIVTIGGMVIGFFVAYKAILITSRVVMGAYNIGLGLYNALTGTSTVYTEAQSLALATQTAATELATVATEGLNLAMFASPLGVAIGALGLLGIGYATMGSDVDEATAAIDKLNKSMDENILLSLKKTNQDNANENELVRLHEKAPVLTGKDFGLSGPDSKLEDPGGYKGYNDFGSAPVPEVSSKDVQHKAVMSKLEQTNHAKATITLKAPAGTADVSGGGKNLEIKTVSTHPQ